MSIKGVKKAAVEAALNRAYELTLKLLLYDCDQRIDSGLCVVAFCV